MGTPGVPESTSKRVDSDDIVDVPRVGMVMWLLLGALLIPPAVLTLLGHQGVAIPHQTLWVILLGVPFPALLLSLPRRYTLKADHLIISGFLYRKNIPTAEIVSVVPIGTLATLLHPGSLFSSDPQKSLLITRREGRGLVISPANPGPFLGLTSTGAEMNDPRDFDKGEVT